MPVVQAGVTVQVPAAALAAVVGQAVLFEQGADLAARTLVDVVEAGVYEIVGVLSCTSAAAGAGQVTLGVTWTDLNGFQTFGLVLLDMDVLGSDEGTLNEFAARLRLFSFLLFKLALTTGPSTRWEYRCGGSACECLAAVADLSRLLLPLGLTSPRLCAPIAVVRRRLARPAGAGKLLFGGAGRPGGGECVFPRGALEPPPCTFCKSTDRQSNPNASDERASRTSPGVVA